jgi:hypothetical protein
MAALRGGPVAGQLPTGGGDGVSRRAAAYYGAAEVRGATCLQAAFRRRAAARRHARRRALRTQNEKKHAPPSSQMFQQIYSTGGQSSRILAVAALTHRSEVTSCDNGNVDAPRTARRSGVALPLLEALREACRAAGVDARQAFAAFDANGDGVVRCLLPLPRSLR